MVLESVVQGNLLDVELPDVPDFLRMLRCLILRENVTGRLQQIEVVEYFPCSRKDGSRRFIVIIYEQATLVSIRILGDVNFTAGFKSFFGFVTYDRVKEGEALRQITKSFICRFYLRYLKAIAIFHDSLPTSPDFPFVRVLTV